MQDTFAVSGDESEVTDPGDVGIWETVRVSAVDGENLTTETPLTHTYDSSGKRRAQACTIPEYTHVELVDAATIQGTTWDGNQGGFVGFFASGNVSISARRAMSTTTTGSFALPPHRSKYFWSGETTMSPP